MAIGDRLRHTLTIQRATDGELDEDRQPVRTWADLATVRGHVSPKSVREVALLTDAGAVIADHTAFLLPTDVREADRILHDASACPVAPVDYPDSTYHVRGVRDGAGVGHHLEVDVSRVEGLPA